MRFISVERVKPGDTLGQSILGVDGCIMLREGVTLTERYINKLISMGILYIYIKDSNLEDIKPQDPQFVEYKSEAIKSLSRVFSRLNYSDTVCVKNALSAINDIIEYLIDNNEIDCTYLMEIKTFDNYTYVHSLNTCVMALFFGVQMSFSRNMLIDLGAGTLLHDLGKTKVPISILNKNGKLTKDEFDIVKKHPEYGYEMVKNVGEISEISKSIILEHHERIDGNGYPQGLSGGRISKYARVACISDVYDAIASDRVYRKGFPANEAYEFILGGNGTFFDPQLVNIFKNNFSVFPLGACVRLSDGVEGFVVGHNKGFPDKPIIRVLYDIYGNKVSPFEINLVDKLDITIEKIIL